MTASLPIKPFFSSVFLILALSLSLPAQSPAQSQRETPKETALRDALKSISPSAVEPFKAGTEAMDKEDWALAITEFRKVLVKAPTFEAAQRRLGISLVESGQVDEGKPMLEQLVVAHRSPENLAALAQAVGLPRNGQKVSQADQERALELASDADRLSVDN
ncbi:MAG TPA: hypothetical protein VEZ90_02080, partial [Blastocatellia bacterium]|nr:hypothetical protein [Blastocatellia bacterium]